MLVPTVVAPHLSPVTCCPVLCPRFCLIQHPAAEQRVLQELVTAGVPLGDLEGAAAALSRDLLGQLPYTTAVLQEAMRLYPAGVAASPR
jgi:cytochrome P450